MRKINILLFDLDGVIVNPLGYRVGIAKTVELLCKRIGLENYSQFAPTEKEISYLESKGVQDVWDITNIIFGKILTGVVIRYRDRLSIRGIKTEEQLAEIKKLKVTITRPSYIRLANELYQSSVNATHLPDIALAMYSYSLKSKLNSGQKEMALGMLKRFLVETRSPYRSYGTRLFQNVTLGSNAFEKTYGLPSDYKGESLLKSYDKLLINSKALSTLKRLRNSNTFVGICTGRPSYPPKYSGCGSKGYSPEAEVVLKEAGVGDMPLIAMGMIEWLGEQKGKTTEELTKPNVTQALAAVICAINNGNSLDALYDAYEVDKEEMSPNDTELLALKGKETVVYVFEDTISGIKPLLALAKFLNEKEYDFKIRQIGVARDANKIKALKDLSAVVFPDVNLAIEHVAKEITNVNKQELVIVDYGAGNLKSVKNALAYLGADSKITSNPSEIGTADKVILPGVGAFGFMMQGLRSKGLESPVKRFIEDGKPFLGICLGMQALFEESEESPGVKGLGVFKGKVVKFRNGKVPQIGWNKVVPVKPAKGSIFREGFAYFVNSYYVVPKDESIVAATTDYFGTFASAIQCRNVIAVQFHPEKSSVFGIKLLRRWLKC